MRKIILLLLSFIVISCNENIEKDFPYNYEEYSNNLINELNSLGENLRDNNRYFNDSNSVEKALFEVFGESSSISNDYKLKINNFKANYQKKTFKNKRTEIHRTLVSKIQNLLMGSNNIDEYEKGLTKLFNELEKKDIDKSEKHKNLIYLKTQITFLKFISSNADLFPPPNFSSSSEEHSQKNSYSNQKCRKNSDCPKGKICCEGYCRYPTASDMCPAWLGAMWGVALVEPTPFGEAAAGVVSGVVGGYYVLTRSGCIAEYVKCKYRNTNEDCSRCLQFCIVQGEWCY